MSLVFTLLSPVFTAIVQMFITKPKSGHKPDYWNGVLRDPVSILTGHSCFLTYNGILLLPDEI